MLDALSARPKPVQSWHQKVLLGYILAINPLPLIYKLGREGSMHAFLKMKGNGLLGYHSVSSNLPLFPLTILFISLHRPCLGEMRDPVKSPEEPDSILTGSVQSKGKGVEALTLAPWQALISPTSLFISGFLLVATAAELKFPSPRESSALCNRVLHSVTLLVSAPPNPHPLTCLRLPLCRGRQQARSLYELLQGQMHL